MAQWWPSILPRCHPSIIHWDSNLWGFGGSWLWGDVTRLNSLESYPWVVEESCPWGSLDGGSHREGAMKETLLPAVGHFNTLFWQSLTSRQLAKERCLQGPTLWSQRRQWRVDLELRSNKLKTGTLCARTRWILLQKFWVWGIFGNTLIG